MWHIAFGCVFLVLNTVVALAPAVLLVRRYGDRTRVVVAGVAMGQFLSFVLGGFWFVGLPALWAPPRPADFNWWGWFALSGGFSMAFSWAGCTVVFAIAGLVELVRRFSRHQRTT